MISFRAIEKSDLPIIKVWRNSDDVMPYCREYRYLSDHDQEKWFESYQKQRRDTEWDQELMVITNRVTNETVYCKECEKERDDAVYYYKKDVGVGGFTRIEWKNRKAELSFYLGDCKIGEREELFKASLLCLLEFGFNRFNLNKIYFPVYAFNPHLKLYQTIFKTEAILKQEYYWDDKYHDRYYLSLLKEEFKTKEPIHAKEN